MPSDDVRMMFTVDWLFALHQIEALTRCGCAMRQRLRGRNLARSPAPCPHVCELHPLPPDPISGISSPSAPHA